MPFSKKKSVKKVEIPKKKVKVETVLEDKKVEVPIVVKPAEPRLICNYCGGELLLLRKVDNQTEYKCTKCHRGLAIC